MTAAPLYLLVALPAEAKPLNHHFGLQRDNRVREWPIYRNRQITLLRCGVGLSAAEAATRWLAAGHLQSDIPPDQTRWLNIGIAGHPTRSVGEAMLVSSLHCPPTQQQWQMRLPAAAPIASEPLFTLNRPDPDYSHPGLCDLEGAGFYPAALAQCAVEEQVQLLKIISDNRHHPLQGINAKQVSRLIEAKLEAIEQVIELMGCSR